MTSTLFIRLLLPIWLHVIVKWYIQVLYLITVTFAEAEHIRVII